MDATDPRVTFTLAAIAATRDFNAADGRPEHKGMRPVLDGYNEIFTERFGEPSRETTDWMADAGLIVKVPVYRKGAAPILILAEDYVPAAPKGARGIIASL